MARSLRAVADSSANVVKKIDYDSFGDIVTETHEEFKVLFGFAGGLHDRDTGLVRFGFRDYDPDVGRWTAKDPILFAGGDMDLYGYVLNDPINFIDPKGMIWVTTNSDHHAISNWYRGALMYVTELIGVGMKPIAPGDDSFIGATKTITQTWQPDPENPERDSAYPIGTTRTFDQKYIKHITGPDDIISDLNAHYWYRWEPYVSDYTYDYIPGVKLVFGSKEFKSMRCKKAH